MLLGLLFSGLIPVRCCVVTIIQTFLQKYILFSLFHHLLCFYYTFLRLQYLKSNMYVPKKSTMARPVAWMLLYSAPIFFMVLTTHYNSNLLWNEFTWSRITKIKLIKTTSPTRIHQQIYTKLNVMLLRNSLAYIVYKYGNNLHHLKVNFRMYTKEYNTLLW